MLRGLELRVEDGAHGALLVDHVGHPAGQKAEGRRYAVALAYGAVAIRHQAKRQVVLRREAGVRVGGVRAHADDLGTGVREILILIAERARLLGAAGRVVLRVEVEHDRLAPAKAAQANGLAAVIGKLEVWSGIARLNGAGGGEKVEKSHAAAPCQGRPAGSRGRSPTGEARTQQAQ